MPLFLKSLYEDTRPHLAQFDVQRAAIGYRALMAVHRLSLMTQSNQKWLEHHNRQVYIVHAVDEADGELLLMAGLLPEPTLVEQGQTPNDRGPASLAFPDGG